MITLKEFSQLISEFINNNFVPLLQAHNAEHNRLLDTWKSVSRMLTDIEKVDYQNLEASLKGSTVSLDAKENYSQQKKFEPIRVAGQFKAYDSCDQKGKLNSTAFSADEGVWKGPALRSPVLQKTSIFGIESRKSPQRMEEGLDKLIISFRKLVKNLQANHRKLLREQPLKDGSRQF